MVQRRTVRCRRRWPQHWARWHRSPRDQQSAKHKRLLVTLKPGHPDISAAPVAAPSVLVDLLADLPGRAVPPTAPSSGQGTLGRICGQSDHRPRVQQRPVSPSVLLTPPARLPREGFGDQPVRFCPDTNKRNNFIAQLPNGTFAWIKEAPRGRNHARRGTLVMDEGPRLRPPRARRHAPKAHSRFAAQAHRKCGLGLVFATLQTTRFAVPRSPETRPD